MDSIGIRESRAQIPVVAPNMFILGYMILIILGVAFFVALCCQE